MATAASKQEAKAVYTWSPGPLSIRPASPKIGFKLDYDIVSLRNVDTIIAELDQAQFCSLDTETTSLDPDKADLCCISFCYGRKAYVAYWHHSAASIVLDHGKFRELVACITRRVTCYFNVNYDYRVLKRAFPELDWREISTRMWDAQSLIFLSDTNIYWWTLKTAAKFFLGTDPPVFEEESYGEAIYLQDPRTLTFYAGYDAYNTYHLFLLFFKPMQSLYPFILKIDQRLALPMIEFEENTIDCNFSLMQEYAVFIQKRIDAIRDDFFGKYGEINLGSNPQKASVLTRLGYDTGEKTATGAMSVGIKLLEKLVDKCDAAKLMIDYSRSVKLLSSYISPVLERQVNNLPIRFKYRMARVPTWRLAAGSYSTSKKKKLKNLGFWISQNIQSAPKPAQAERRADFNPSNFNFSFHDRGSFLVETGARGLSFRRCFEVDDDHVWLSTDFKSQELVVIASESGEPVWVDALKNGADLHKEMAVKVWGAENYDKNKRKKIKSVNFGLAYGIGAPGLAKQLNMTEQEAQELIDDYARAVPRLMQWMEEVRQLARRQGFLLNAYGLPRQLAPYYRMGRKWASFADRTAVNTQIQSCGSVIIRMALVKLWELIKNKYQGTASFLLTIHDEINLKVAKSVLLDFLGDFDALLLSLSHPKWPLKIGADHSIGQNWAEVVSVSLLMDERGKVLGLKPNGEEISPDEITEVSSGSGLAPEDLDCDEDEDVSPEDLFLN